MSNVEHKCRSVCCERSERPLVPSRERHTTIQLLVQCPPYMSATQHCVASLRVCARACAGLVLRGSCNGVTRKVRLRFACARSLGSAAPARCLRGLMCTAGRRAAHVGACVTQKKNLPSLSQLRADATFHDSVFPEVAPCECRAMATPTRLGRALFREEIDFAMSRATARSAAARTGRALARRLATRDVLALSRERERGWAAARRGAAINLRQSQLTIARCRL